MSISNIFKGTGVAIVTPFRDGQVDYNALSTVINHIIHGKVEFIVTLGTTGEATSLSHQEALDVVKFTVDHVAGRVPIILGAFGGNNTAELVHKLKTTDFTGISAVMSSSPAYVKPTQEGIYQHYIQLADASPLPVLIYNVPSRTSMNVRYETIIKLAETHTNILGVKEASADLYAISQILKYRHENFVVLSGDDMTAYPTVTMGADGLISVIANAYPFECSEMIRCARSGDLTKGLYYHQQLLDIHPWLFAEGSPTGIKGVLEEMGLCSREVRLPLAPLTESTYDKIVEVMI